MSANDDKKPARQRKATQKKTTSRKTTAANGGEAKPKPKRKYVTRKTTTSRRAANPKAAKAAAPVAPAVEPVTDASTTTAADLSRKRIKAALSGSARPAPADVGRNGSAQAARETATAAPRSVSSGERRRMIAERAYELALARGFRNGNPVDDWLAAEAEIDAAILISHDEG